MVSNKLNARHTNILNETKKKILKLELYEHDRKARKDMENKKTCIKCMHFMTGFNLPTNADDVKY